MYLHDLSEAFPSIELGADGRYGYEKLPLYWSAVTDDPDVFDIAEFFVLRRYRRSGVGRGAAFFLWNRFPGRWVVRVSEGNPGALRFWTDVIGEYTMGTATQFEHSGNPNAWRVFSFDSEPLARASARDR